MLAQVHGELHRRVHARCPVRHPKVDHASRYPRRSPGHGPASPASARQRAAQVHPEVDDRETEGECHSGDVHTPGRQQRRQLRRSRQWIVGQRLSRRGDRLRRVRHRRRRVRQCGSESGRRRDQEDFPRGEPQEVSPAIRVPQPAQYPSALPPASATQQHQQHRLQHEHPPVRGGHKVQRRGEPDQGRGDTAGGQRPITSKRQDAEPFGDIPQSCSEPARNQHEQREPTQPHSGSHEVHDHRARGRLMGGLPRGVARHRLRHQRREHQTQRDQQPRTGPHDDQHGRGSGDEHRPGKLVLTELKPCDVHQEIGAEPRGEGCLARRQGIAEDHPDDQQHRPHHCQAHTDIERPLVRRMESRDSSVILTSLRRGRFRTAGQHDERQHEARHGSGTEQITKDIDDRQSPPHHRARIDQLHRDRCSRHSGRDHRPQQSPRHRSTYDENPGARRGHQVTPQRVSAPAARTGETTVSAVVAFAAWASPRGVPIILMLSCLPFTVAPATPLAPVRLAIDQRALELRRTHHEQALPVER